MHLIHRLAVTKLTILSVGKFTLTDTNHYRKHCNINSDQRGLPDYHGHFGENRLEARPGMHDTGICTRDPIAEYAVPTIVKFDYQMLLVACKDSTVNGDGCQFKF